ncbi:MAG: hypothetical protein AAGE96_06430 [Cyanobacteria bacterium P01_G01_bin.19]
MKLLKFGFYSFAFTGLLVGLNQTSALAFTLDLFTDANDTFPSTTIPYQTVEANPIFGGTVSASDTDTGLSDVAWGQRRLDLTSTAGITTIGDSNIKVFGSPATSASVNSESGTTIDSAMFTWGFDTNTDYEDITDNGADNTFGLDIVNIDLNGADIVFSVTDNNNDRGSVTVENITSTGSISFPYNDILTDNPDVTLGNIKKIEMEIVNVPTDFDVTFDLIESRYDADFPNVPVPFEFSPSLGLLLCSGVFGFKRIKKRLATSKA